ncbi:MAG: SMC-Scp complex subunit ScpB [Candidatus Alkanophagales archaeon]|nr:MAG: SMC-Scp complex subunit ScpB [Candidatus Alkanophagales archaeon]
MKREVEAILFSSSEPVSIEEIAKKLKVNVGEVDRVVDEIVRDYESRDTAIEVVRLGDRVLMRVKLEYQYLVSGERDLDRSTLRTLGVIAMNQPIELSKLAKIRGNRCYEHVRRLEKLGLIRSEKKGRTKVLTVTEAFLRYFGLNVDDVEKVGEILRSKVEGR